MTEVVPYELTSVTLGCSRDTHYMYRNHLARSTLIWHGSYSTLMALCSTWRTQKHPEYVPCHVCV